MAAPSPSSGSGRRPAAGAGDGVGGADRHPVPPWWREPSADRERTPSERARRSLRARIVAAVLTAVLQIPGLAIVSWQLRHGHAGADPLTVSLTAAGFAASALLLLPWRGPGVVAVAAVALPAIAVAPGPPLAALPVAVALVRAVLGGAGVWAWSVLAGMVTVGGTVVALGGARDGGVRTLLCTVLLCLVAGAAMGARGRRERFRAATRERAERRRSAAEEERLRIARELHDVLAHSLSQISVQAGVGLHLFDDDPERARESLRAVRETSTQALEEVRDVLGVLREPRDGAAPPRGPSPSLAAIDALVAEAIAAGQDVALSAPVPAASHRVPAAVEAACYRTVQEAVTNARRHAPGAATTVAVALGAREVRVTVENTAPRPAPPAGTARTGSTGRGILGMQERAAALGGRLEAGPTPAGGFRVTAVLPYRPVTGQGDGTGPTGGEP